MKHIKYLLVGLLFLAVVFGTAAGIAALALSSKTGLAIFIISVVGWYAYILGRGFLNK